MAPVCAIMPPSGVYRAAGESPDSLRTSAFMKPNPRAALSVTAFLALSAALPWATSVQQDVLTPNIDRTSSPRDDFFQYANGEWLNRHPIPDDQARWGVANLISDEVYSQVRRISEEAAAKDARPGSAEQLIGDFWATGMDAATINRQGLSPLQPVLDRIDRIQSIADVIDVVAAMHRRTMLIDGPLGQQRVFFSARVEQDARNSRRRIYTLSPGGISMRRPAYSASDPQSVKVRTAFREYLFRTFMRLGGDSERATASVDAVFNLEAALAASVQPDNEPHRIGAGELGQFRALDWKRYFSDLGAGAIEFVDMRQPQFFQALDSALRAAPLDDWKDYLRYWLVRLNAPFLDDETYSEFFAFESAITGQPQPRPRWRRVAWQEKNWLGLPLVKTVRTGVSAPEDWGTVPCCRRIDQRGVQIPNRAARVDERGRETARTPEAAATEDHRRGSGELDRFRDDAAAAGFVRAEHDPRGRMVPRS